MIIKLHHHRSYWKLLLIISTKICFLNCNLSSYIIYYIIIYHCKLLITKNSSQNLENSFCSHNPAKIYLFKVNNRSTRKRSETCSELAIKTLTSFWYRCHLASFWCSCCYNDSRRDDENVNNNSISSIDYIKNMPRTQIKVMNKTADNLLK